MSVGPIELAVSIAVAAYVLMFVVYQVIKREMGMPHFAQEPDFGALNRRIEYYASLKGAPVASTENASRLDEVAHEVLLGTLKKVEAKNASLTTLWVFLITSMLLLATSEALKEVAYIKELMSALIFVAFPFLLSSLAGMKQLDQIDANRILTSTCSARDAALRMQNQLKRSLIAKETDFRFSYCGAAGLVFILMLFCVAFVLNFIWSQT